uniref:Cell division cycle protein 27 homolog n=1 Tax=Corethrella appendiculata TaxID=1370023 RepID=U5EPH1_9DIPT
MIVQEPVQAAIWHCLNHYAYQDAIFLAERLCAEVETEESLFLLATCYYRSGQIHQAHWLLSTKSVKSTQCRFLLAKCAYELKQFSESENVLTNDDHLREKHLDEISKEYGEIACFILQLLSKICQKTERTQLANEACRRALKLNPFLWQSFADLCNRGEKPDPNSIFQLTSTDIFQTSQGNHNSYLNSIIWFPGNVTNTTTATAGVQFNNQNQLIITSNANANIGGVHDYSDCHLATPIDQVSQCYIQNLNYTPNSNNNNNNSNSITHHNTSLTNLNNTMVTLRGVSEGGTDTPVLHGNETGTPFRKQQFRYLSAFSPTTPSFGVLPLIHSPNLNEQSGFISTPSPQQQQQQQMIVDSSGGGLVGGTDTQKIALMNNNKKLRGNIGNIINRNNKNEQQQTTLLQQQTNTKPIVFSQTGNQLTTPRTPNTGGALQQGQNVRRSSRLFSNSNYSVKENNKSPQINNKFVAPRSPPRKTKQRISKMNLNSSTTLMELNDKKQEQQQQQQQHRQDQKEKIETITSSNDDKVFINNQINSAQKMAQHVLQLKKQSADGLMMLLRDLGHGYMNLQSYECEKAIKHFSEVGSHHYNSSWVKSMIAIAYHEQRDYESAVNIFREIHDREPHRLQFMEIYSTDLWHLQKDVILSALAQDLMQQDKTSPITWCVAGNCFSAHKEHETAIKFFQRAIQVDPDFAYSYTLLGHELVMTEELDKALSCFRTSILKDSRHYTAWFGIGTIFSKQERYQLAEIHYRRALQINPRNSVVMVHIGVMQFFLQKTEQALQTLNQAIAIDSKNPLCKFHRGSMYFTMGRFDDALKELEELKQIVPKESVVYYLIGKIHKKLGNVDLALMHLSWATDLGSKGANNQIKDNFDAIIRTQDTSSSGGGGLAGNSGGDAASSSSSNNTTTNLSHNQDVNITEQDDIIEEDGNEDGDVADGGDIGIGESSDLRTTGSGEAETEAVNMDNSGGLFFM